MKMCGRLATCVLVLSLAVPSTAFEAVQSAGAEHHHHHHKDGKHHHHHHKGKHHHHKHDATPTERKEAVKAMMVAPGVKADTKAAAKPTLAKVADATKLPVVAAVKVSKDEQLVEKMKALESKLANQKKKRAEKKAEELEHGHLLVSGPLPADFAQRFSKAVAAATGSDAKQVSVTKTSQMKDQPDVFAVDFKASPKVVKDVESQAGQDDSKLASGNMHSFLVSKDDEDDQKEEKEEAPKKAAKKAARKEDAEDEATPVEQKGIDIDTAMPYGDLEPFGREDTAQELTEDSVQESNSMVDQLERAEVAEEKRSVFRALTRLRGAAITSFDGVARSQTGNIDEYNKIHKWRSSHPLHHLADEESDISKWAFPDNADF
jgi:hypothetical protein